jgi:RimJ/RimL family protein N-acetyltransferase
LFTVIMTLDGGDAGRVGLGLLEATDALPLRRFFFRLSPETLYRRFHSPIARPEQAHPERLLDVDHHDREAVVAVLENEIVGVARYVRRPGADAAEVAVVVADAWQRQGLATRMLGALSERALCEGVRHFTLNMQSDNVAVLRLARRLYPEATLSYSQGACEAVVRVGS